MKKRIIAIIVFIAAVGTTTALDSLNVCCVGRYNTGDYALDVYVSGSYAYVADDTCGLRIINISDPSSPFEVGFFDTRDEATSVYVSGDYAYIGDDSFLRILDISTPSSPFEVGLFNTGGGLGP